MVGGRPSSWIVYHWPKNNMRASNSMSMGIIARSLGCNRRGSQSKPLLALDTDFGRRLSRFGLEPARERRLRDHPDDLVGSFLEDKLVPHAPLNAPRNPP